MPTLVRVGSAILDAPAATDYARALAAGAPDSVTSSYRDAKSQEYLYEGYIHHKPGFNFALDPAHSDHVKGIAIDLKGSAAKAWFRAHGATYGWAFTDPNESWHIAWRPGRPGYVKPGPHETINPAHIERIKTVGTRIIGVQGKTPRYLISIDQGLSYGIPNPEHANALQRVSGPFEEIIVNQREFDLAQEMVRAVKAARK